MNPKQPGIDTDALIGKTVKTLGCMSGQQPEDVVRIYQVIDRLTRSGSQNFRKQLDLLLDGKPFAGMPAPVRGLLKPLRCGIFVPRGTEPFVAKKHFVPDESDGAKVRILPFSADFERAFLRGNGKIEPPCDQLHMTFNELTEQSFDHDVVAEIGGESKAETTLRGLWYFLEKQGCGQHGDLRTNDIQYNMFFIRDIDGILHKVRVWWMHVGGEETEQRGWQIDMFSVADFDGVGTAPGTRYFYPISTDVVPAAA